MTQKATPFSQKIAFRLPCGLVLVSMLPPLATLTLPGLQLGLRVRTVEMLVEKIDKVIETAVAVAQMLFNPTSFLILNRSSHVCSEVKAAETTALELRLHDCALFFAEF